MKNLFFYLLITCVTILSTMDIGTNISNSLPVNEENVAAESDNTDCYSSYKIYGETAYLWQASWVSYYNRERNGNYDSSPQLSIDSTKLDELYAEVQIEQNPGVMIWYVMLDTSDVYPTVAIQNTANCSVVENGTIYMAQRSGGNTISIDTSQLRIYKENWKEKSGLNSNVYIELEGYNYSWATIKSATEELKNSLYVSFGLRTIEPGESDFEFTESSDLTGCIVYCNVIYGSQDEYSATDLLDFALPCPTYCD